MTELLGLFPEILAPSGWVHPNARRRLSPEAAEESEKRRSTGDQAMISPINVLDGLAARDKTPPIQKTPSFSCPDP